MRKNAKILAHVLVELGGGVGLDNQQLVGDRGHRQILQAAFYSVAAQNCGSTD
jgi:hypothetical protein